MGLSTLLGLSTRKKKRWETTSCLGPTSCNSWSPSTGWEPFTGKHLSIFVLFRPDPDAEVKLVLLYTCRVIQESFVNMENMFDLMAEKIEVEDAPNALPLMPLKGKIDFRNVSFTYNSESESQAAKPVLKGKPRKKNYLHFLLN